MKNALVWLRDAFTNTFPIEAKCLFLDLLWPAAAGNVAWAVAQVAIDYDSGQSSASRLAVLILLAIYLIIDWSRSKSLPEKSRRYWKGDAIHLISIVAFAVAVAGNKSTISEWSLAVVFLVGVVGHSAGVWEVNESPNGWRRFSLAFCGGLGIVTLIVGHVRFQPPLFGTMFVAFVIVFAAWIGTRMVIVATKQANGNVENNHSSVK